jgi:hypothetical protein
MRQHGRVWRSIATTANRLRPDEQQQINIRRHKVPKMELAAEAATSDLGSEDQLLGEPEGYTIPRQGDRDLAFTGWRIGHAASEPKRFYNFRPETWTEVSVYLTKGKNLVTHVVRWAKPKDKEAEADHSVGYDPYQLGSGSTAARKRWAARWTLQTGLGRGLQDVA